MRVDVSLSNRVSGLLQLLHSTYLHSEAHSHKDTTTVCVLPCPANSISRGQSWRRLEHCGGTSLCHSAMVFCCTKAQLIPGRRSLLQAIPHWLASQSFLADSD